MKTLGVILAGGQSTRMGTDKAALEINGESLLQIAQKKLQAANVDDIVINHNQIHNNYIPDIIPGKGPLSGIHAIATKYPDYNLMILPIDIPLISSNILTRIIQSAAHNQINTTIVNNNFPLFLINDENMRRVLEFTLTKTNQYSVGRFCGNFQLLQLPCEDKNMLLNINTRKELEQAKLLHLK